MVEDDEVARLEVEAVQTVAGALGVVHVLIDDVRGALGVVRDALADLPSGVLVGRMRREVLRVGFACLMEPNLPKRSKSSSVLTV